jgi:hypothetical protein
MATFPEEMEDLAKIPGGLLINFGTLTSLGGMIVAGMNSRHNSTSQSSQYIKGNTRIRIKSPSFLILWGWEPHPFVSVRLQVRFDLS